MDVVIILIAIGWAGLSAVGKKKKKQDAERRREEAEASSGTSAPVQAARPAEAPRPAASTFPVYAAPSPAKSAAPAAPARPAAGQMRSSMRQPVSSRLTSLTDTVQGHVVEASSISGHAHEETSLTGSTTVCEPAKINATRRDASVPTANRPLPGVAFRWDPNAVLHGIVMMEILDKPLALRQRR